MIRYTFGALFALNPSRQVTFNIGTQLMIRGSIRMTLSVAVLTGWLSIAPTARAQVVPPAGAAPISGSNTAKVGDEKIYRIDWGTRWPQNCRWEPSGAARVSGEANNCDHVTLRFTRTGSASVDFIGWSHSGTVAGGTVYWPDVSPKGITVTSARPRPGELVPLSRTTGPYVIRSRVMRNRRVVGATRSVTATESQVVNLTGGVSTAAPRNVNYVCSTIVDRPTGAFPAARGRRISRCKRV